MANLDAFILTSVSRFPDSQPAYMVGKFLREVTETLRKGGNVLVPCTPTGIIYDLFEQNISRDVPVYFISPVADSALAYANIFAEYLSEKKSSKVYIPEEPFMHSELAKSGRIKVYSTIHDSFSREYRSPCVVFTGHPSLRIGDAVHFLDMWGSDTRNVVILTDPDYPMTEVYTPYQSLQIRAHYYPIETRMDYTQIPTVLQERAPRLLIMPDLYSKPVHQGANQFLISHTSQMTFRVGDTVPLPLSTRRKRVSIDDDILRDIELHGRGENNELGMCRITGLLSAYDNKLELSARKQETADDATKPHRLLPRKE
ncbi:hypothetical protein AAVH_06875 [Aphelenchoides avenae]|nr:hypothetical protein AAVH_06875 [Aphelenchus avenae]